MNITTETGPEQAASGPPGLGEQLDIIMRRMDVTSEAWAAAGYPYDGPAFHAREDVYEELRAFNQRVQAYAQPGVYPA